MTTSVYILLEGSGADPNELGPFNAIRFANGLLYVNADPIPCGWMDSTGLHITDGGRLGNLALTGTQWPILWGQAKQS